MTLPEQLLALAAFSGIGWAVTTITIDVIWNLTR